MTTHLDRITATDGYLFVTLEPVGETDRDRALAGASGDEDLGPACRLLLAMFDLAIIEDEARLRAVVGGNTLFAAKTPWGRACIVLPTGSAQTKSAARALRRILKKLVPAANPRPISHAI